MCACNSMLTDGENLQQGRYDERRLDLAGGGGGAASVWRHLVINYSDVLHGGKDNTQVK